MVSRELRARLTDPEAAGGRNAVTEPIWNYVWWRRLTYFATLTATLLLLALPMLAGVLPPAPIFADGRTWIGGVIRLLALVLPAFAGKWVEAYADNPFYFLLLGGVILLFLSLGTRLERTLRDEARKMWRDATAGAPLPEPPASWVQKFRNSFVYQRFTQFFKWNVLPNVVVAPLLVLAGFWFVLAAYAQTTLPFLENGSHLCQPSQTGAAEITSVARDFRTRDVCSQSFGLITKDQRYAVTFDVVDPWADSKYATNPEGIAVGDYWWAYLGAPYRRVLDARYLEPVREIRPSDGEHTWFGRNTQIYPVPVRAVGDSVTLYRAEFTAERSGELFLFANDAMIPLSPRVWGKYGYRYFYEASGRGPVEQRGNHGNACVTVERVSVSPLPVGVPPAGSTCAAAAKRNADQAAAAQAAAAKTTPAK